MNSTVVPATKDSTTDSQCRKTEVSARQSGTVFTLIYFSLNFGNERSSQKYKQILHKSIANSAELEFIVKFFLSLKSNINLYISKTIYLS
jgi:hypothetical protein